MFTVALFTIAKIWMQIKCPLRDEWIKKMWCVEYYTAIEKGDFMAYAKSCIDLECIMLK